jgi:hypothetical protein
VLLATILGHLFRCLYYRQGQCRADGFCKASWIAQVFGVSERAVKTARRRLEALGFLQRTETPQWVRNRYAQKMTINLQWDGTAVSALMSSEAISAAPPATLEREITPPDSNKKLSETKHQKPACDGATGVLSTLVAQARECLRTGTSLLTESAPVLTSTAAADVKVTHRATPRRTVAPTSPPHLQHVLSRDLQDIERLLVLHVQAVQTNLIGPSEADRLAFVALAHHVLHFRPANPGGLFLQPLRQRRFHLITQEEEDRAQQSLKRYCYAETWALRQQATG